MGKTKNFYLYFLLSVSTIVCSCSSDDVIRENVMQSESVNWCPDSLGWYRDKPEDKRFYATCCIESELLYVKSLNNGLVKVTDKCCKKKEHCVLCHEGFGQSVPPETIVHIIEDTLDFILRFLAMA